MIKIKFTRNFVLFANTNGEIKQHHVECSDNKTYVVSDISHANENCVSFKFAEGQAIMGTVENLERTYVEVIQKPGTIGPPTKGCC